MKQVLIATVAGLMLAVAGCSQLYEGMRSGAVRDEAAPGSSQAVVRADGTLPVQDDQGAQPRRSHPAALSERSAIMMAGDGGILNLTDAQRAQLAQIRKDLHRQQQALMAQMPRPGGAALAQGGEIDEQAERQAYDARAAIRRQLFENSLQARKRIHSLLTPQQRQQWLSPSSG